MRKWRPMRAYNKQPKQNISTRPGGLNESFPRKRHKLRAEMLPVFVKLIFGQQTELFTLIAIEFLVALLWFAKGTV